MRFTWLEFADAKIRVSDLGRNRRLGTIRGVDHSEHSTKIVLFQDTSDIVFIS